MRADDLLTLVALDVAGALAEPERQDLRAALDEADAATRREVATLYEAAAGLAGSGLAPSPSVRERILAHAFEGPAPATAAATPPRAYGFTLAHEGWQPYPVPGIMVKLLSIDEARGIGTLLLKAAPGSVYPAHDHVGAEECYVIDGDVTVMGRRLGPGDFHHADAGTAHGALTTEHGTTVLLVVALADLH